MQWTSLNDLREKFLTFFEGKEHLRMASAPLIPPKDDTSLLLINSGMAPLKKFFLGQATPPRRRVTTCQKCVRTEDIEHIGKTDRHGTYFEMLGNFSFGDYFKHEATKWAWEFITQELKMPVDKLWVSIYEGDEETRKIWVEEVGVAPDRIVTMGKEDNFWEIGAGPCGPCSEIHYDLRSDEERRGLDGRELVNKGHHLVIEIWNLVFMQFNRKADGRLEPLPARHVDTGMGFERLCMVLQGKQSNYDTDVFQPTIGRLGEMCGRRYGDDPKTDVAMRVVADHLRAIAFSIADGQLPSNVKAGYVIRRILRRAVRYGYTYLGFDEPFICRLVDGLVAQMGGQFP